MALAVTASQRGLPWLSTGDLPNPGIKPWSPALQTDPLLSQPLRKLVNRVSLLCLWASKICKSLYGLLKTSLVLSNSRKSQWQMASFSWWELPLPRFLNHWWNLNIILLNCSVGEDSWESIELQGDQTSQS